MFWSKKPPKYVLGLGIPALYANVCKVNLNSRRF